MHMGVYRLLFLLLTSRDLVLTVLKLTPPCGGCTLAWLALTVSYSHTSQWRYITVIKVMIKVIYRCKFRVLDT